MPAGHLDPNETIFKATKREIKEESGLDVELSGICQIGNRKLDDDIFVSVIFSAKVLNDDIHFDPNEILDVKWFTYEEILPMKESLRNEHLILGAINNVRKNLVAPISIVKCTIRRDIPTPSSSTALAPPGRCFFVERCYREYYC